MKAPGSTVQRQVGPGCKPAASCSGTSDMINLQTEACKEHAVCITKHKQGTCTYHTYILGVLAVGTLYEEQTTRKVYAL